MNAAVSRRPRVLVVEDEQPLRELVVVTLGAAFDCEEVGDGEEALRRMQEAPPDLVVLDAMIPGLSGHDVLRAMRTNPALGDVPVLVVSAWQQEEDIAAALAAGANAFLGKPFRIEELEEQARELLRMDE